MTNYKSYEECFHKLYYVYVGLPFGRDMYNGREEILWRALKLNVSSGWKALIANADIYIYDASGLFDTYCTSGKLPKNFVAKYGSCSRRKLPNLFQKLKGGIQAQVKWYRRAKKSKKSVVKKKKKKKRQKIIVL